MVVRNWLALKDKMANENKVNYIREHIKGVGEYNLTKANRVVMNKEIRDHLLEISKHRRE